MSIRRFHPAAGLGVAFLVLVSGVYSLAGKLGGGGGGTNPAIVNPALVYIVDDSNPGNYLVVASGDQTSKIRLTNPNNADILHSGPSWSPDGSLIAFMARPNDMFSPESFYVIRPDGTGRTWVGDTGETLRSPLQWSSSMLELVYSAGDSAVGLFAMDLATGVEREILPFGTCPDISPDLDPNTPGYQDMIAFSDADGSFTGSFGNGDVFVAPLRLDASGRLLPIDPQTVVNLTSMPGTSQGLPAWSPDGKRLAYWDWDRTAWRNRLLVRDLTTGGVVVVASYAKPESGKPTWTSDGKYIVYPSFPAPDLMIAPSDGSAVPWNLTRTGKASELCPDWNPAWNPAGAGGF